MAELREQGLLLVKDEDKTQVAGTEGETEVAADKQESTEELREEIREEVEQEVSLMIMQHEEDELVDELEDDILIRENTPIVDVSFVDADGWKEPEIERNEKEEEEVDLVTATSNESGIRVRSVSVAHDTTSNTQPPDPSFSMRSVPPPLKSVNLEFVQTEEDPAQTSQQTTTCPMVESPVRSKVSEITEQISVPEKEVTIMHDPSRQTESVEPLSDEEEEEEVDQLIDDVDVPPITPPPPSAASVAASPVTRSPSLDSPDTPMRVETPIAPPTRRTTRSTTKSTAAGPFFDPSPSVVSPPAASSTPNPTRTSKRHRDMKGKSKSKSKSKSNGKQPAVPQVPAAAAKGAQNSHMVKKGGLSKPVDVKPAKGKEPVRRSLADEVGNAKTAQAWLLQARRAESTHLSQALKYYQHAATFVPDNIKLRDRYVPNSVSPLVIRLLSPSDYLSIILLCVSFSSPWNRVWCGCIPGEES
ncbi:hypothetical protein C8R42DRAFT_92340 [Lentinula raphanica]|nr:hypothetical protein C8R42DRAFT_92340 [Lentinula raphanica]